MLVVVELAAVRVKPFVGFVHLMRQLGYSAVEPGYIGVEFDYGRRYGYTERYKRNQVRHDCFYGHV